MYVYYTFTCYTPACNRQEMNHQIQQKRDFTFEHKYPIIFGSPVIVFAKLETRWWSQVGPLFNYRKLVYATDQSQV